VQAIPTIETAAKMGICVFYWQRKIEHSLPSSSSVETSWGDAMRAVHLSDRSLHRMLTISGWDVHWESALWVLEGTRRLSFAKISTPCGKRLEQRGNHGRCSCGFSLCLRQPLFSRDWPRRRLL